MTLRVAGRPSRRWVVALGATALVCSLLSVVLDRSGRATAGTVGAAYGVYVTDGAAEVALPVNALGSPPASVINTGGVVVGATALNSTATLGVATVFRVSAVAVLPPYVNIFDVPSGAPAGIINGIAPVAYAMDPLDPTRAFGVSSGGTVYSLTLGPSPTSTVIGSVAVPGAVSSCDSLAVTPDGATLVAGCNVGLGGYLASVAVTGGAASYWSGESSFEIRDLAVEPGGGEVVVAAQNSDEGVTYRIPLPLGPNSTTDWFVTIGARLYADSIAVSRDGGTAYVGGTGGPGSPSWVESLAIGGSASSGVVTVPLTADANGQGGLVGLALVPDGGTLLAAGQDVSATGAAADLVFPISTSTMSVGPASISLGTSRPVGPRNIAVTPDQAPVAALAPVSGTAGVPLTLDASSSSVAYGSITGFAWNFGDGTTASTSGPTVTHTFGAAGSYVVTVTETDAAANSLPPAPGGVGAVNGPGTTAYLQASASAQASIAVGVAPPVHTTSPVSAATTTSTTKPASPGSSYHPTIVLVPTVGDPGTVVEVTGAGFPPGGNVTVAWSQGSGGFTETADIHGNLPPRRVSILRPDVLGPRQAKATVQGNPATASAPFLVVPGTAEPGRSGSVLFRSEGP
ncbi:MAG: PKD domain-containing protein [Acidobacteriota bacterium]|nr:PKD domain-containing protein [Acidobacteriota bacterium]